jgi:outer membrane protein OmpA-like peptidoglycan-associated protein
MNGLHGRHKHTHLVTRTLQAGAIALTCALAGGTALAQATDPIIVDLSVLNDGGISGSGALPAYSHGGNLLNPPLKLPVSKLHVAPSSAPKLRKPSQATASQFSTSMPKKAPAAPMPAAKPKPEKMAVAKVAPPPAPAPKPAVTKAPPPAPMPKPVKKEEVKVAKKTVAAPPPAPAAPSVSAPPPPAPKQTKAPPPAPKVAKAPAPAPAKAPASVAAVNTSMEIKPGQKTRIVFNDTATKIPDSVKDELRTLAEGVRDKSELRLQLMAYAGGGDLSASKARRMSLSRALSVRSYLIENGVRSTRIDVRALGNKTSEEPKNRVDVNIAKR